NFDDITSGNNDYNGTKLYPAGTAYDMASGLGTPKAASLAEAVCGGGSTPPPANTVTVTNPGNQTTTVGSSVSLQISATDSGGASLTYSATGLPAGLSISSSGLISGSPTTAGSSSVTVTATDTTGANGSASFTWTVNPKGGNVVTVTNPGNQTPTVGSSVSLQISATDSGGASLTYSATGLPAGLSISSSGLISGSPTTAGSSSVTVTATDTTGANGSASFSWTVNAQSSCTATQLLENPGFESGNVDWTATSDVILDNSEAEGEEVAEAGKYFAWLDGYSTPHTDTLSQSVAVPAGCSSYTLSYYQHIDTSERAKDGAVDTLTLQVLNSSGTVLSTLSTYSNLNAASGYQLVTVNMAAYAGETITIKWTGKTTNKGRGTTDFCIDTTSFED
ncbi:MAG: putative Ig domain-containing protein, partial [Acidimicrobiales bacterium]